MNDQTLIPLRTKTADAQDVLIESGFRRVTARWEDDIYEKDNLRYRFGVPVWQWDAKYMRSKPLGVNIRLI